MINPRTLVPTYKKFFWPSFAGGKYYRGLLNHLTRRQFRRASEALAYAERCHKRWLRLYDAALVMPEKVVPQ